MDAWIQFVGPGVALLSLLVSIASMRKQAMEKKANSEANLDVRVSVIESRINTETKMLDKLGDKLDAIQNQLHQ